MAAFSLSSVDLLWALHSICNLHRVPFDAALARQHLPPPHSVDTLLHAAVTLGFKAGARRVAPNRLQNASLPCLAVFSTTDTPVGIGEVSSNVTPITRTPASADGEPSSDSLVLVVKVAEGQVLFFAPTDPNPKTLTLDAFAAMYRGMIIEFARGSSKLEDSDLSPSRKNFGFGWFVPELLKHKRIWRDVLLASLAIQLMALATPLFTQVVIDKVIVHQTENTLIVVGIGLLIFMIFTAAMSWVRQYLVLHTGNRVDAVLGLQVFEHLLKLPPRYYERRPTGVVVARVHGVETIREFISGAAVTLLLDCPFLLIFLAIMFYYSPLLSLITLSVLAVIVALSAGVTPFLRARLNQQFLLGARNQAFLTEYVSGMETVKSLQMEPQLGARFGDYLGSYLQASFKTRSLSNTYNVVANMLEQLLTLTILCAGAYLVMNNDGFTIGMLVAFQMFAGRLSQPMLRIVGLWQEFQQAAIAVKRLGDVMDAPAEPYSLIPARAGAGRGSIEISGLSFRYADNVPYLYTDLNLKLNPGACVALMGPSGSGKSTLAKLLQGFYLPSDGQIKIDGHDSRHLSANELRQNFGVVPQETTLFSGTIYDNLTLANPHATFEQVIQACKLAEIHETIESLPEGYQTQIGEHGAGLSGGQKQRVAIARALLKQPRILIFDEATSHLDSKTAEAFAATINRLKGKVTMLFIAHQLPSGLKVDGVVTLGQGRQAVQAPVHAKAQPLPTG